VYVGGLDWTLPCDVVRERVLSFLAGLGGTPSLRDLVTEAEVAAFPEGKRRDRDAGKEHQGYMLLRFPTAEDATSACGLIDGQSFTPGALDAPARGVLKASIARDLEELGEEDAHRAREKLAARDRQRLHNIRQRKARVDRLGDRLDGIIASIPSPGGFTVLSSWRAMQPRAVPVHWDSIPGACDPGRGGGLHEGNKSNSRAGARQTSAGDWEARSLRKRWQVESFLCILLKLFPPKNGEGAVLPVGEAGLEGEGAAGSAPRPIIVDFGCGSGNLTLALAWLMPHCDFVGVDMNAKSISIFNERVTSACLANARGEVSMIEAYEGPFDAAVALHACGCATDYAMEAAVRRRASFVVSPCCIGKLKFSISDQADMHGVCHPRSKWMLSVLSSPQEEFAIVARAADISHNETDDKKWVSPDEDKGAQKRQNLARVSKLHVEMDRSEYAREQGYTTLLLKMLHAECSPKNDFIVGVPSADADLCSALAEVREEHAQVAAGA